MTYKEYNKNMTTEIIIMFYISFNINNWSNNIGHVWGLKAIFHFA